MYAAAGGASLASRQARQRQRQENNKNKALLQQAKLDKLKSGGVTLPIRNQQSRQFHQLPSSYLRTPQAQARKLSASFQTQSKLLLPICESNNQLQQQQQQQQQQLQHSHSHQHHSHYHYQDVHQHSGVGGGGGPLSPKLLHSQQYLTKSATATLPLVCQAEATPPATPTVTFSNNNNNRSRFGDIRSNDPQTLHHTHLQFPQDSIIVTPATPHTSPGHHNIQQEPDENVGGHFERKCSFYRIRKTDAFEHDGNNYTGASSNFPPSGTTVTTQYQADPYIDDNNLTYGLPNGGSGHKWVQATFCEHELCTCDQIECAQGRAAWLERGRRCSVQDNNAASCHRRWVKRNRIQDSSLGGSSDDEDFLGVLRGPSSFANAFLYVGLGTIAIGLVIAFVGTGEKGFKTVELRLIGPSLIGIGLICCILRICFCICPSHCISSSKRARKKNNKIDADHTTSLLRGESKRVSIAKGPHLHKFPLTHKSKGNTKMLNEGMEALRQIATTSLFLQNEKKSSPTRVVPIIKEPEKQSEEPLEMKRLHTTLDIQDISDDEDNIEEAASIYNSPTESLVPLHSKLGRQRFPTNQNEFHKSKDSDSLLMETSLMIINPTPPPPPHSSLQIDEEEASLLIQTKSSPTAKNRNTLQSLNLTGITGSYQYPSLSSSSRMLSSSSTDNETLQPPLAFTKVPTNQSQNSSSYTNRLITETSIPIASTSSANPQYLTTTIIEPELVLSPAKLGQ